MPQVSERLMNWASIVEPDTLAQAKRASEMPFIYPHLALMPDAHRGLGATVGSVIPTLGAIMPAAVGVDIGCGMIAVRTQHTLMDIQGMNRARLRRTIEKAIPLSAGRYNRELTPSAKRRARELEDMDGVGTAEGIARKWRLQLGSLGSGNHFIEVTADELDRVWLFLHSGSRGVGNQIAQRHIKIARSECQRRSIKLADRDLAYLEEGTPQFDSYIRDLTWAQRFALLNREEMMDRLAECFGTWIGEPVAEQERINCHHNYSMRENHYGKDVWLSRKGAINAAEGVDGLIPGSMGTASYVVVGKGNKDALDSAPHGAGRNYSRTRARKTFTHEQLREAMAGIEWRDTAAFLDEIPEAYKDIDVVMADAADLVEIRHTLRQIVNVKGE